MANKFTVGIDIGTFEIKVIVAEQSPKFLGILFKDFKNSQMQIKIDFVDLVQLQ